MYIAFSMNLRWPLVAPVGQLQRLEWLGPRATPYVRLAGRVAHQW